MTELLLALVVGAVGLAGLLVALERQERRRRREPVVVDITERLLEAKRKKSGS